MKKFQENFFSLLMNPNLNNELSEHLIPAGKLKADEVMWVYYNDYHARLQSVLNEHFTSIWKILGDELFFEVGKSYVQSHPSSFYDLGLYGEQFCEFIKSHEVSSEFPFLSELADLEYTFQDFFHSQIYDPIPAEQLSSLQTDSNRGIILTPNMRFYRSAHPLIEIWDLPKHEDRTLSDLEWKENHFVLYKNAQGTIKTQNLKSTQIELLLLLKREPFLTAMELGTELFIEGEEHLVSEVFQFLSGEGLIIGLKKF